jgi:DNA polymerase-3 subunit epsilon
MTCSFDPLVAILEETGDYRILRRLAPQERFNDDADENKFVGIIVDTETTGLDVDECEVIELGMVRFEYGQSGRTYRVLETFSQLQQPSELIPREITQITGITDSDVAGQRIDDEAVTNFLAGAAVVIAHNAQFDRPFCEMRWPVFSKINWGCSMSQIPWHLEGHEGTKLGYLLNDHGLFHDGHRAADDCRSLLKLLALPVRTSHQLALAALLETARKPTFRIWAMDSPYDSREVLKARKYRWCPTQRCWHVEVEEDNSPTNRPTLKPKLPVGGKWQFEIKLDGYRTQLHLRGGNATVFTGSGLDWTDKFAPITEAAKQIPANHAVIDGEIIVRNEKGAPDFGALRAAIGHEPHRLLFYTFECRRAVPPLPRRRPARAREAAKRDACVDGGRGRRQGAPGAEVRRHDRLACRLL